MKNRRLIGWIIGIPVLVVILILVIRFCDTEKAGISRAEAIRSVVYAVCAPEDFDAWRRGYGASHFPADELEEWYVPYLDYAYEQGWLQTPDVPADAAHAEAELTCGEAQMIVEALAPGLGDSIRVAGEKRTDPCPYDSWWLLYDSIRRQTDPDGEMEKASVLVYGTPGSMPEAAAWTAYTNLGELRFDGLSLDGYVDHELMAYVRGSVLIHVIENRGQNVTYRNVWILDGDEEGLRVYLGDIERTIAFRKKTRQAEELAGTLADIRMTDGRIAKVSLKQDAITGKVLSVREHAVEIEGYGVVELDDECKVLKTYGEVRREKLSDILVGYDMQQFVVAEGKICAVLTVREFEADTIRVLLMTSGFSSMFHDSVSIVCDRAVTMTQGDETERIEAGQEITFTSGEEELAAGRILLEPEGDAEIRVTSIERSLGTPSYAGRLELLDTQLGLVLINDLYLEDYLAKVVPSEMPSNYEKEALKAQAVCARTYAWMQIQGNTYSRYGAHVDDSTNFQVYNNVETDARTAEAVRETYGQMLLYEGNPVSAYYFSTSCGVTSDLGVWGGDPEETPWLKSVALQPGGGAPDLTDNDDFLAFITDTDYPAFDSAYPLYRWSMVTNVNYLTDHIDGVGTVESIRVTERGAGGVAQKLLVRGTDGERTIEGQSAIRSALADPALTLVRNDGQETDGWSSLPSGFLAVEEYGVNSSGVRRYKIYGGGYGHGVGMSQNGAQGMAKAGYTCEEILGFFYSGVTVGETD